MDKQELMVEILTEHLNGMNGYIKRIRDNVKHLSSQQDNINNSIQTQLDLLHKGVCKARALEQSLKELKG